MLSFLKLPLVLVRLNHVACGVNVNHDFAGDGFGVVANKIIEATTATIGLTIIRLHFALAS
jgi:hypothetical protein